MIRLSLGPDRAKEKAASVDRAERVERFKGLVMCPPVASVPILMHEGETGQKCSIDC